MYVVQITELAGYTSRVAEMFEVFLDMKKNKYIRSMVSSKPHKHQLKKVDGPLEIQGTVPRIMDNYSLIHGIYYIKFII